MLTKLSDVRPENNSWQQRFNQRTRATLWTIWTLFVIVFASVHWHFDLSASRPLPVVGLVIHTIIAGLVGLIVLTVIEMRLDPERFDGSHEEHR